jgi:hypothetical protein
MTEAEWLTCDDPVRMAAYMEGRASERALVLLCCACCRRLWHLLETAALRQALDTCERFADGAIDEQTFRADASSTHPLMNYRHEILSGHPREEILWAAYAVNAAMLNIRGVVYHRKAIEFAALAARPNDREERSAHVNLIRDVFGNPFHPAVIHSDWLRWSDGLIVRLATTIYAERCLPAGTLDRGLLGILADALLDAGCDDEELIAHCRSEGPHVRGCWAVDLILGKQ